MPKFVEVGLLATQGQQVAIIVSRFNSLVTDRLMEGAVDTFRRHGIADDSITVVRVPGSFELPLMAQQMAKSGHYQAIVCLGAVIQGETTHHEYINHQTAAGILKASLDAEIPITFGVLTCQTMDQALDRAGGKAGNKGHEAAIAAIEMMNLLAELS